MYMRDVELQNSTLTSLVFDKVGMQGRIWTGSGKRSRRLVSGRPDFVDRMISRDKDMKDMAARPPASYQFLYFLSFHFSVYVFFSMYSRGCILVFVLCFFLGRSEWFQDMRDMVGGRLRLILVFLEDREGCHVPKRFIALIKHFFTLFNLIILITCWYN